MLKECKKHGLTEYVMENRGWMRCKKCRSENVKNYRRRVKERCIEFLGGKCSICGYNKCNRALEIHHLDPNEKEFGIASKGWTRKWETVKTELEKCILLCSNCHREIHSGVA